MISRRTRIPHGGVALVVALAFAGCSEPPEATVSTYRGNAARTGVMPGPGPAGTPHVAWMVELGGPIIGSPLIAGDKVYATSGDGTFHAWDLATGEPHWTASIGAEPASPPLLLDGLLVVGDIDGVLHALDTTNATERWSLDLGGSVSGGPAAVDDDLLVGTEAGAVTRVRSADGSAAWSIDVGAAVKRSLATDGANAYVPLPGEVLAVSTDAGAQRWRSTVAGSGSVGTPAVVGDFVLTAAAIGGEADDTGVVALDAATGELRWRHASSTGDPIYTPAIADGRAFVVGHDERLVALDLIDGEALWSVAFERELQALPVVVGREVVVVENDGPVTAFDISRGDRHWSVPIEGTPSTPAIAAGRVVLGTSLGRIYTIEGEGP